ncbi:hypothetical protein [Porphyrobacter sp. YT40]|uniref:hypothetical protein n=1 Tax=Porphyrobacter sp. YT40 TaxID=2547601 RepID=UPI0011442228|nr:hypothetical protein [Porphyrobacter sp. YT40]QDH33294.1 hypothetical protein E2E27_02460 [Porphyrobacter sp. YT40]
MYKAVFQNSKAALAFAAMILFSAVSMVGTSEDNGVLIRAVDNLEAQRASIASDAAEFAERNSDGDVPKVEAPEPKVFGEFTPADEAAARQAKTVAPKGPPPPGYDLMTAPLAPGAQIGDDQPAEPVITDRQMTIEPN